ncbi:MAG: hypothetical protein ACREDR_11615, partial [Blastocatellia bacterium]
MIYLSGALKSSLTGKRPDVGVMVGYRKSQSVANGTNRLSRTLWAADNGCFTDPNLNVSAYLAWLQRLQRWQETCLFATAPDVVGDCEQTWERSRPVLPANRKLGYAAALVAQDGIEDKAIPWDAFDCLFVGGSTEWKLSTNTHGFVVRRSITANGFTWDVSIRFAEFCRLDSPGVIQLTGLS